MEVEIGGMCSLGWGFAASARGTDVKVTNDEGDLLTSATLPDALLQVATCSAAVIALTANGDVYSCGNPALPHDLLRGFLFDSVSLPFRRRIVEVAAGKTHALLRDDAGQVLAFGSNNHGQLGSGNVEPQSTPAMIDDLCGLTARRIACGGWHSLVLCADYGLFSFGWNDDGQLGKGTKSTVIVKVTAHIQGDRLIPARQWSRMATARQTGQALMHFYPGSSMVRGGAKCWRTLAQPRRHHMPSRRHIGCTRGAEVWKGAVEYGACVRLRNCRPNMHSQSHPADCLPFGSENEIRPREFTYPDINAEPGQLRLVSAPSSWHVAVVRPE